MSKKSVHRWYNNIILDQGDIEGLEHEAALNEFEHGMPRQDAEAKAYKAYKDSHHRAGAAHHLQGLRAAQAAGDIDEAQKHGVAYSLHMNALGLDPMDAVPEDISKMLTEKPPKVYKFRSNKADTFLVQK